MVHAGQAVRGRGTLVEDERRSALAPLQSFLERLRFTPEFQDSGFRFGQVELRRNREEHVGFHAHRASDARGMRSMMRVTRRVSVGSAFAAVARIFGTSSGSRASGKHVSVTTASASTRIPDRKSTRLNSSHVKISYAVFCLK